ncbi:hypothetical protein NQS96_07855 [Pseudoalteromonas shioyasakiensis]|uniref:hypothetical protein n=1 Tax=Pseudoalteromonas shioyasakiensis TaxID=1190813 RepID=UPI002118CD5B|nr:hypothetical protein [Pseudoalteromonas shioyasakiensis]MCQ8881709.1 hypothetical protein [Pseudoalteromonas shioyasakiensis]
MGKREFFFGVIASIVAAFIMELAGVLSIVKYLKIPFPVPVWAIISLLVVPIMLAILWFRKSINPEHQRLIQENSKIRKQLLEKERALSDHQQFSSSLEKLLEDKNQSINTLNQSLEEWRKCGVMLHQNDEPLELVTNQNFGVEIVEIDGKNFLNCEFVGSILKFKGTGPIGMNHCNFSDVRWVMDGPAGNALELMGSLYRTGDPILIQMVEATFARMKAEQTDANDH